MIRYATTGRHYPRHGYGGANIFVWPVLGSSGAPPVIPPTPTPDPAGGGFGAGTTQRFPKTRRELRAEQKSVARVDRPSEADDSTRPDVVHEQPELVDARLVGNEQAERIAEHAREVARVKAHMRLQNDLEAKRVLAEEIKAIEAGIRAVKADEEDTIILVLFNMIAPDLSDSESEEDQIVSILLH